MKKIYMPSDRAELVTAVRRGETVPSAARRLGVTTSTAYAWVRSKSSESAPSKSPAFLELMTAAPTALVVRVGVAEVEVRAGFDADLLRAVVAALDGGAL
jgi:transposase-like protein